MIPANPDVPGGIAALIVVSFTTTKFATGNPPAVTAVAPVKPEPVMVTAVPPVEGPEEGLILLTAGPDT